jgi:hypothetical protein
VSIRDILCQINRDLRHVEEYDDRAAFIACRTGTFSLYFEVSMKVILLLGGKWEKPYSEVCGYVNARMSIAIVRATHLCIRGSRIPTGKMCNRLPQWEDKAGLGLFRHYTSHAPLICFPISQPDCNS